MSGVVRFDAILTGVYWVLTTCPDGTNSDVDDGDDFTCVNNLILN